MADTCQKSIDSGKIFFIILSNTVQICTGFKADTPEKIVETRPSY